MYVKALGTEVNITDFDQITSLTIELAMEA